MSDRPRRFHTIVMHHKIHLEEIVALVGLSIDDHSDAPHFPGISQAKIEYVDAGTERFRGWNAWECEAAGILPIGVMFSRFDEHTRPTDSEEIKRSKNGHCAATLLVEALELNDNRQLKPLIGYADRSDRALGNIFEMAHIVNLANKEGLPAEEIRQWALKGLWAKYQDPKRSGDFTLQYGALLLRVQDSNHPEEADQWFKWGMDRLDRAAKEFFGKAAQDFGQATKKVILLSNGEQVPVTLVVSDSARIQSHCFYQGAAMVLVKTEDGHVRLHTNPKALPPSLKGELGKLIRDAGRLVKMAEDERRGRKPFHNWRLMEEGSTPDRPEWFIDIRGNMLLNGSLSNPHVPATKLSLEEIFQLIELALVFEPHIPEQYLEECSKGGCPGRKSCINYDLGMLDCRRNRSRQRHGSTKGNPAVAAAKS